MKTDDLTPEKQAPKIVFSSGRAATGEQLVIIAHLDKNENLISHFSTSRAEWERMKQELDAALNLRSN